MDEVVVDTSIVIDYLRGKKLAVAFLESLQTGDCLSTHAVVVAEVLVGARNQSEQNVILRAMREFRMHAANEADCMRALDFLATHRLAAGVEWNDCLIAATCLRSDLPVATLNERHFRVFEGLTVVRPYGNRKRRR